MNRPGSRLGLSVLVLVLIATGCGQGPVSATIPSPRVSASPTTALAPTTDVQGGLVCPPDQPLPAGVPVAARVNGQGISLDLFNRQLNLAQVALLPRGVDSRSSDAIEAVKSLKSQVLDQMINEVIVAQQAEKEGIRVSQPDLDVRLAQLAQGPGPEKLNAYLGQQQLTLAEFCAQIRSSLLGDVMIKRVTAPIPTFSEQAYVRQILVSTSTLAQSIINRVRQGEDFAALARQYSIDEASRTHGGDLGWIPAGMLPQELDTVVFTGQLAVNQISEVITTGQGYHVLQVTQREKARALAPEMIQAAQQRAWLAWLQAVREGTKVERFVQP